MGRPERAKHMCSWSGTASEFSEEYLPWEMCQVQPNFGQVNAVVTLNFRLATMSTLVESTPNGLHTNGSADIEMEFVSGGGSLRFSSGLILPPPEIKCAHFVPRFLILPVSYLFTSIV